MGFSLLDAVADISSSISNTELFEFGDGSSNGLKSQNILEKIKICSENPPALLHEKRYDGRTVWKNNIVTNKIFQTYFKHIGSLWVVFYNKLLTMLWFVSELPEKNISNVVQCR